MKYLIHADGALPNLALMRLAGYYRSRGEEVRLVRGRARELWDPAGEVFGSSIFGFSTQKRTQIEASWGPVRWGGTGVRLESNLSEIDPAVDWEAVAPDYADYPEFKASIGFTQRGCRLKCSFCVVPKKEGKPKAVHTISDIWRGPGHPKKIVLLDNDFFGQPRDEWKARINEIFGENFRVCFSQGINLRQVDESSARALAGIQYRDNKFQERRLYCAWDNLADEPIFKRGVQTLRDAGIPPKHLMVYMLIGFRKDETWAEILYRFNELVALGCDPYPMVYNNERKDLKAFQRWAVTHLYKSIPWEKYKDRRLGTGSGRGLSIAEGTA